MRSGTSILGGRRNFSKSNKRSTIVAAATACEALESRLLLSRPGLLLDLGTGQVALSAFDWSVKNTGGTTTGGGGAGFGKAVPGQFTFAAPLSAASPGLLSAL